MKSKTIILFIIFAVGITLAFLVIQRQYSPKILTIGNAVPDIELVDTNQKKHSITEFNGSVIFINFWATWCEPCIDELPSIEILFRRFSKNPQFKVITVLFKDDLQNALTYMKKNGYTFPVYLNPDGMAAKKFGITGVPETFVIDKRGFLRYKWIGPEQWDTPIITEMFDNLINEE